MDFGSVVLGKGHEREHILLGLVHQLGELFEPGTERIGDLAPLGGNGDVVRGYWGIENSR